MTTQLQIKRLALIAAIGCAMLIGLAQPAAARPIDDPTLPSTRLAQSAVTTASTVHGSRPHGDSRAQGSDWTLPIVLTGGVLLIVVATGYARKSRTSRRAVA